MVTIREYIESHTALSDSVLDAVERWAHLHTAQPQMICGPAEGMLLTHLCRSVQARCAVEVGAFVGYSTICIARGLAEGGTLHSFEVNEEYADVIRRHLAAADVDQRVDLQIGDAKGLIPKVFAAEEPTVDFAFVDADKRHTKDYYDLLVPRMRRGGLLLVDNVLWGGKVLDTDTHHDADTLCINDFNNYVQQDPRVANTMLEIRDGLLICRVL